MFETRLYILDGKNPVQTKSYQKWGQWMEQADRHVRAKLGEL